MSEMRKLAEKLKRGRREARKAEREGKACQICCQIWRQTRGCNLLRCICGQRTCASPCSPLTAPRRTKRRVRGYLSFFLLIFLHISYNRPVYVLSRRISCYTTCGLAILYSLQTHCYCCYKILSNLHDTNTVPITYLSISISRHCL